MLGTVPTEASRTAHVLVFTVHDVCFCPHLDWVEPTHRRADAPPW